MPSIENHPAAAEIVCPFPGAPDPSTAGLKIYVKYHMTAADLREVRVAVIGLPVPWFLASEDVNADTVAGHRWTSSYIKQIAGPAIAHFSIYKDGAGYMVDVSDGNDVFAEWHGFPTAAAAVSAIWAYTTEMLTDWGLVAT